MRLGIRLVICWAACALLLACNTQVPKPQQVTVPDVVGLHTTQAHEALESAALHPADDLQAPCPSGFHLSRGGGEAVIMTQQPAPRTMVVKGTIVHLHAC